MKKNSKKKSNDTNFLFSCTPSKNGKEITINIKSNHPIDFEDIKYVIQEIEFQAMAQEDHEDTH